MRDLLDQKALKTDRAVLLPLVLVNATVLAKFELNGNLLIGLINGSLAGVLLAVSIWRPRGYAKWRLAPIILLRLLVAALPLFSDTIGPFAKGFGIPAELPGTIGQLARAAFVLLVGVTWAVGLFIASFLLLPPVQHLAVQAVSLGLVLYNNRAVCEHFLAQHPSNITVIQSVDAALRALAMSMAPTVQHEMSIIGQHTSREVTCMAASAAIQVSLGAVLPTLLAWQLQSRMAASIAAQAAARHDSALEAEVRRSQHATLCTTVARATQGCTTKLLLTGSSMLLAYIVSLLLAPK